MNKKEHLENHALSLIALASCLKGNADIESEFSENRTSFFIDIFGVNRNCRITLWEDGSMIIDVVDDDRNQILFKHFDYFDKNTIEDQFKLVIKLFT